MPNLQNFHAKVCYTAAGILIVDSKVLLIKHKKLGLWLNPGGHIEPGELPHQAAEREFFEETGVRVRAVDVVGLYDEQTTEFLPNPLSTNLHWISKENYWSRLQNKQSGDDVWKKGCEQHINFLYLMQPMAGIELRFDQEETLGIEWFDVTQLDEIELSDNIRQEIKHAMLVAGHLQEMKQVM
jgi:ADP-ribose pyrophosphatase YjhB (NUDIX family)